jgi:hypothetical protein
LQKRAPALFLAPHLEQSIAQLQPNRMMTASLYHIVRIKAGDIGRQHNQTLVRDLPKVRDMRVKIGVKAGTGVYGVIIPGLMNFDDQAR